MSQNDNAAWAAAQAAEWEHRRRPLTTTDPIEIPGASSGTHRRVAADREEDQRDDDGEAAAVPPHVLLARRRAAASSVCSGQGRTLKGRDLRRVRESVLRMTGFIES